MNTAPRIILHVAQPENTGWWFRKATRGKEVMVMETAYPWTRDAVDETADNILMQGASIDAGKRPITAAEPYLPEFRLDVTIADQKGTITASRVLYAWDGQEWQEITTMGGECVNT